MQDAGHAFSAPKHGAPAVHMALCAGKDRPPTVHMALCAGKDRPPTRYRALRTEFAVILLHEALHHAGLSEALADPGAPSAREINRMVETDCGP